MPYTVADRLRLFFSGKQDYLSQADCYLRGEVVAPDRDIALMLYQHAVNRGLPGAYFKLGLFYHHMAGYEKHAAEAYFNSYAHERNLLAKVAVEALLELVRERTNDSVATAGTRSYSIGEIEITFNLAKMYEIDKDWPKVIDHCKQAIALSWEQGSECELAIAALNTLANTHACAAIALAELYLTGPSALRPKVVDYYKLAKRLGSRDAAFELGKIYQNGLIGIPKNKQHSLENYFEAAKLGCEKSLKVITENIGINSNPELKYQLAEVYKCINQNIHAAYWYYYSARGGHALASEALGILIKSDSVAAYEAGKLYQTANPEDLKAYQAYGWAVEKGHSKAKEYLIAAARESIAAAQYVIGIISHEEGNFSVAIKMCLRAAEQDYPLAIDYLESTVFKPEIYRDIASHYSRGNCCKQSNDKAIEFYQKAIAAGDDIACLLLAAIYESRASEHIDTKINMEKSCAYALEAYKKGIHGAKEMLIRHMRFLKDQEVKNQIREVLAKDTKQTNTAVTITLRPESSEPMSSQKGIFASLFTTSKPPNSSSQRGIEMKHIN